MIYTLLGLGFALYGLFCLEMSNKCMKDAHTCIDEAIRNQQTAQAIFDRYRAEKEHDNS